ncbi:sulfite exporter TauE/SafE family protein [Breznakia pachnodae]|uniref:Probable membrane transporter protein n=1 Tax=Breznakia pachnodae TaxID=265178 RepID=A0ABU0DZX1_9FIRM|nr:sulfite exporter TauE/SafE family protein [Breznakia pachnodae]MDQ0360178.1 putative membrane protein YfcA [Breznakia pachnodae]
MKHLIYFIVIFLSNTIGSIAGLGGGVIIKPMLDMLAYDPLSTITIYSSIAVFAMSISSTYKQIRNGVSINYIKSFMLAIGSVLGGFLGNEVFNILFSHPSLSSTHVLLIQIVLSVLSLLLVLFYNQYGKKSYHLTSNVIYLLTGIFLGSFSTLLGIGGGPINVTVLIILFSLQMKEAVVYSIITIFFSQLSKLISVYLATQFHSIDLSILVVILPAAFIGGYLGGYISKRLDDSKVKQLYKYIVVVVILINLYNAVVVLV